METQVSSLNNKSYFPSSQTLTHAAKFAMQHDIPIKLDYYQDSCNDRCRLIEHHDDGNVRNYLYKTHGEDQGDHTSDIQQKGKSGNDFIFITETSIYICSTNLRKKVVGNDRKSLEAPSNKSSF